MNTDASSGRHCQARPLRPAPKRTWACNLLQGRSVAAPVSVVYVFVAAARVPHPAWFQGAGFVNAIPRLVIPRRVSDEESAFPHFAENHLGICFTDFTENINTCDT